MVWEIWLGGIQLPGKFGEELGLILGRGYLQEHFSEELGKRAKEG